MSELEATLRSMAKSGRLNHVSVGFINGKWSGSYRGVEDRDGRVFESTDVVAALVGAMTGRKIAPPIEAKPVRKQATQDEDLL